MLLMSYLLVRCRRIDADTSRFVVHAQISYGSPRGSVPYVGLES